MKRLMFCVTFVVLTSQARAEEKAQAPAQGTGGMEMSKMGPWTRKPANEKQTKKEVTDFLKHQQELWKKGAFDEAISSVDYPVYMITDDAKGAPEADGWSREKYVSVMKGFFENMPKDSKETHKTTVTVLSDSLATVIDDFTMTMGKQKLAGRNSSMLIKRDGQWKWKMMAEAGWGGMGSMPADAKAEMKK